MRQSFRWLRFPAIALVAVAVTGCAVSSGGGYTRVNTELVRDDAYTFLRTAAGRGEMKTEVYGDPFGEGAGTVRDRTIAAMQGHYRGHALVFSENPAVVDKDIHVTVAFEPPDVLHSADLCRKPDNLELGRAAGDSLNMSAAFCLGNQLMATAHLRGPNPGSSDSAAFDRLVGELTWNVLSVPVMDRDAEECRSC